MVRKPKKAVPATAGKNQGGRPELAAGEKRDTLVRVLTNSVEYEELKAAAAYVGLSLSTWLRVVGLERAARLLSKKRQHETATSSDMLVFVIETVLVC